MSIHPEAENRLPSSLPLWTSLRSVTSGRSWGPRSYAGKASSESKKIRTLACLGDLCAGIHDPYSGRPAILAAVVFLTVSCTETKARRCTAAGLRCKMCACVLKFQLKLSEFFYHLRTACQRPLGASVVMYSCPEGKQGCKCNGKLFRLYGTFSHPPASSGLNWTGINIFTGFGVCCYH